MNNRKKIIFITGLPCIGKSTLLSDIYKKAGREYIKTDNLRNKIIFNNTEILKTIGKIIGKKLRKWPPSLHEYPIIYTSPEIFLQIQSYLATKCLSEIKNIIIKNQEELLFIEISPFMLFYTGIQEESIFLTLRKNIHLNRIQLKTNCNKQQADYFFQFYTSIFRYIEDYLFIDKIIDMELISNDVISEKKNALTDNRTE